MQDCRKYLAEEEAEYRRSQAAKTRAGATNATAKQPQDAEVLQQPPLRSPSIQSPLAAVRPTSSVTPILPGETSAEVQREQPEASEHTRQSQAIPAPSQVPDPLPSEPGPSSAAAHVPPSPVATQDNGPLPQAVFERMHARLHEAEDGPLHPNEEDPLPILEALPPHLVRQLPALMGEAGLSETAYGRLATSLRLLVEAAPVHKPLVLAELQRELAR